MSYDEHLISMAGGDGGTVDQLAAIEARSNAATEGPWAVDELGNVEDVPELDLHRFDIMPQTIARTELRKEDGEFIAHARTDVPALLALVREQRAALALIANQVNAAEMLCRMNERDPALASVPAAAIRAVLTGLNP